MKLPGVIFELTAQNMGKPSKEQIQLLALRDDARIYKCYIERRTAEDSQREGPFEIIMDRTKGWPSLASMLMERVSEGWITESRI